MKFYKILFPNGKMYCGLTSQTLEKRLYEHSICKGMVVGRAIRKYGIENVKIVLLHEGDYDMITSSKIERYYIWYFQSVKKGYNRTYGGEGGVKTEEQKIKISRTQLRKGRPPQKYRPMRQSKLDLYRKPILCITLDNEIIIYPGIREAARLTGFNRGYIQQCCAKKLKSAYGCYWCYESDLETDIFWFVQNPEYKRQTRTVLGNTNRHTSKPVMSYTLDGTFVQEYRSISFAAKSVGTSRGGIQKALASPSTRTSAHMIWKYKI